MTQRFDTISFFSDYGTADGFVGVVKSVIRATAPHVTVIDMTHGITPHDVRAGGLALARAAEYMVPGVVLAVVDPWVGTARRPVVIEVGGGQSYLVGPDNGLFGPVVGMVDGATAAVTLNNDSYHRPTTGTTFAGRDIFGPVAAHLCNGVPLTELGTPLDPVKLLPGLLPVSEKQPDGSITAEAWWIDRFGNVQINVAPEEIEDWPSVLQISGDTIDTRMANKVSAFSDISAGSVGLLADPSNLLSIAIDQGSAAVELGISEGDRLVLSPAEAPSAIATPVALTTKPSTAKDLQ